MSRNVEKLKTQVLQLRVEGLAHHRTLCWCSIPMFRHKLDLHRVEYSKIHHNIDSSATVQELLPAQITMHPEAQVSIEIAEQVMEPHPTVTTMNRMEVHIYLLIAMMANLRDLWYTSGIVETQI